MARYRDYVRNNLVPAFGTIKLDQLAHRHIAAFVTGQLACGRGRAPLPVPRHPVQRARRRRPPAPPPPQPSLSPGAAPAAVAGTTDLDSGGSSPMPHPLPSDDPEMADLFEVLIGTGMRKGEALGLHWNDVHLDQGVPHPLHTLRRRQPASRLHDAQDPVEQRLGRHLTPRGHRAPPPRTIRSKSPRRPQRPVRGAGLLPARRSPARTAPGTRPTPPAVRGGRRPPGHGPRPAASRRHHHHHRRRSPHRGLQDTAALHPVDHREPLQPPHPTSRTPSRRHHRPRPQRRPAAGGPYRPARAAATTTRPHPPPPRSPPQTPLPRTTRHQHPGEPAPAQACDHTATTTPRDARKAALSRMRERPPTCVSA
ncbi:hypothetical protein CRI70_30035 [Streptomyces sp. Ru87]|nr:hypothetical protein CRI70_30035 [Streptomyces sp. Ru87]